MTGEKYFNTYHTNSTQWRAEEGAGGCDGPKHPAWGHPTMDFS